MKILFVGVLDLHWSTNVEMKKALEELGHEVEAFNYRTIADQNNSGYSRTRLFKMLIDKPASFLRRFNCLPILNGLYFKICGRAQMNKLLIQKVAQEKYDLILLAKADSVNYRFLPVLNMHSRTCYFFMDAMDQVRRVNASAYAQRATWASSTFSDVADHFQQVNEQSYWIMQGIDPERFTVRPQHRPYKYDVVFVGTYNTERARIIGLLKDHEINLVCFGTGWKNDPVFADKLVSIYQESKIVLNLTRIGDGFSVRVFQAMATGAFMLSEYCVDLEKVFKRETHLDWFRDETELVEKIKMYLNESEKRRSIAEQGAERVHKNHTWKHVMQDIVDISQNTGNLKC